MTLFIRKRNGEISPFHKQKIAQAILKAMNETNSDIDSEIAEAIASEIENNLLEREEKSVNPATVEEVQDMVEMRLFKHSKFETAKKYILYRKTRDELRNSKKVKKYKLLSNEFLSKYKHSAKVFPSNLGHFVYLRTYSRFLPEEKRRENWWETVARAVDYNCSLSKFTTRAEAEELFDNIFHFRQFLSGRTMFVGGTEVTKSSGLANFNCAGVKLDDYEKFAELFLLLMLGTGVGIRVLPEDVKLLPKIRQDVEVVHNQFEAVPKVLRKEHTTTHFTGDTARIVIGDSRFGWAKALDTFFEILTHKNYSDIVRIIFIYDNIRPKGERLKTFGGYASGFEPLHRMFVKIDKIIKLRTNRLAPVQLMDIATIIAENVTSGGVRRSSLITAFDKNDDELYSAKSNIYTQVDDKWVINKDLAHRAMSNNSIHFLEEPTFEEIKQILNEGRRSGEPGWQFVYNAKKRRKDFVLTNPCSEILLDDRGNCNLTTINVADKMFITSDNKINYPKLIRAQKLSARASYRMTFVDLELHKWDIIHKRDRLTGASLTGVQDLFNQVGIIHDEKQQREFFRTLKKAAWDAINEIAAEHGTEPSLLVTTIKPEGCTTLDHVRTTDSGILLLDEINPEIDEVDGFVTMSDLLTIRNNKVSKTYKNDRKDGIKITLKNGRELKVTPGHPMSVEGNWVPSRDLKIGQILDYKLNTYENKINQPLVDSSYAVKTNAEKFKTPKEINEDLAWLLGAYFANGSFTTNHRIKFHCGYFEVHEKVQRIWKEQFGVETDIIKLNDRKSFVQDFASADIRIWFIENGLEKTPGFDRIPLPVRRSSKETVLAFITGYADNDGCFAAKTFSIDSANGAFIRHLQEVGEAVGLSFGYSINSKRGEGAFSQNPMYKVNLSRAFSCADSIEYINNNSVKAGLKGKIEKGIIRSANPYTIKSLESIEDIQTYDIEVENEHWYYQGGLKSHNTLSQLPTVSSGIHASHSPFFIRRVRITASDPLIKVAEELGWKIQPENGQTMETANTLVLEFPVKAPKGRTKYNFGAIEQLEFYRITMEEYVDHNTSITVHVREHEWDDVAKWIDENKDWIVAISFLSLDDNFYQLAPYEEIDEETYNKMVAEMKDFNPSLLTKYETGEELDEGNDGCDAGVCPIR